MSKCWTLIHPIPNQLSFLSSMGFTVHRLVSRQSASPSQGHHSCTLHLLKSKLPPPCNILNSYTQCTKGRSMKSAFPYHTQTMRPHRLSAFVHPQPSSMIGLGVLLALAGASVWWLRRFLRADADLQLLGLSPPRPGDFDGKVVWITGASQGLGLRLARYFSAQGAKLILSSRKQDKLEGAAASCEGKYAENTVILPFDMSAGHEVLKEVADVALEAYGGVGPDYIIHNAGASQKGLVEDTDPSMAVELFGMNAVGPITLTQALVPGLVKRKKGHFVAIASMAAVVPSGGQAIYSGSKYALRGYFQSLRSEMADGAIKSTVCCPGPIATGSSEEPRVIFGNKGLIDTTGDSGSGGSKKMDIDRAVLLIATAVKHNLPECWIVGQPILTLAYLLHLSPWLGWKILEQFGPSRARNTTAGDGYAFGKILFESKKD